MKTKTSIQAKYLLSKTICHLLFVLVFVISSMSNSLLMAEESNGYALINGLKMYYEVHGTGGIPLVLIHGGGSTIESSFGNILPILSSYGQVIAVELQAHGRTGDRDTALSFERDADDVAGLLKYLKIPKADVMGFSNGGNTAMQIGIRYPEVVNKLIIISSFYKRKGLYPGLFEGLQKATLQDMPELLKTSYLKVAPEKDHLQVMFDKDRNRMLQFKDWSDADLQSIKAPTLIIVGDRDVVTPEHAVEMAHVIPNARLMILPGSHGSFIGEICTVIKGSKLPEITVAEIEEFRNGE